MNLGPDQTSHRSPAPIDATLCASFHLIPMSRWSFLMIVLCQAVIDSCHSGTMLGALTSTFPCHRTHSLSSDLPHKACNRTWASSNDWGYILPSGEAPLWPQTSCIGLIAYRTRETPVARLRIRRHRDISVTVEAQVWPRTRTSRWAPRRRPIPTRCVAQRCGHRTEVPATGLSTLRAIYASRASTGAPWPGIPTPDQGFR